VIPSVAVDEPELITLQLTLASAVLHVESGGELALTLIVNCTSALLFRMAAGASATVVTRVLRENPAVRGVYPAAEPVTVIGNDPPGTLEDVLQRVRVAVQVPYCGSCDGVKLYWTQFAGPTVQLGTPARVRLTEPLKPFNGVTVTG